MKKLYRSLPVLPLLLLAGCGGQVTVSTKEYDRINDGMSYAQVKKIIGGAGKRISKITLQTTAEPIKTFTYEWKGQPGPSVHFLFQQDKLLAKSREPIPNPIHAEKAKQLALQFEKDLARAKTQAEMDDIQQYYNSYLTAGATRFPEVVLTTDYYMRPVRAKASVRRASLPAK